MKEAIYDEKVESILQLLNEGKTREEISQLYNQDWNTLYTHMHRRGFRWEKELETFVEKSLDESSDTPSTITLNTKAAQIVRMLDVKHPNIKQVAIKQGFSTIEELGEYMKVQGYVWDDELQNYVESKKDVEIIQSTTTENQLEIDMNEADFLRFLMQHQKQLKELLSTEGTSNILTYRFKGNKVNKTLTLASSAAALLEDFHKEYNLTQRTIIETALAEFFERHGYKEQLQGATN